MSGGYQSMTSVVDNKADLVTRIADGERGAESEFVRLFERGVRAIVRRHCRPGDPIVDDLVQEVLTGVIERLRAGAIRDGAALPAYVQAAAVYATTAEYRRRPRTNDISMLENVPSDESPVERVDAMRLTVLLRALLAEMPLARDSEILSRFYLDEQDKDAVCRELNIEPSHFHRVIFRARGRFRVLLEEMGIGVDQ